MFLSSAPGPSVEVVQTPPTLLYSRTPPGLSSSWRRRETMKIEMMTATLIRKASSNAECEALDLSHLGCIKVAANKGEAAGFKSI